MAGGGGGGPQITGGKRASASQDFDLQIAPIIDAFVVLISFLLISASFISIGFFDAGVAAAGLKASSNKKPEIRITIHLKKPQQYEVKVSGKLKKSIQITSVDALEDELFKLTQRYPSVKAVTLKASDQIEYAEVVRSMDRIRKKVPAVLLGGF